MIIEDGDTLLLLKEAAEVRPGDTLILRYSEPISASAAAMIKERIKERLPHLADVVLIQADGLAVYRPDVGG